MNAVQGSARPTQRPQAVGVHPPPVARVAANATGEALSVEDECPLPIGHQGLTDAPRGAVGRNELPRPKHLKLAGDSAGLLEWLDCGAAEGRERAIPVSKKHEGGGWEVPPPWLQVRTAS